MNLWIFNHYAITPDLPGGTRHFDFGKELVKRGHDVTIFASSFNYSTHQETKLASGQKWKLEEYAGVQFIWLKTFAYTRNDWRRVINMVSYMIGACWLGMKLPRLGSRIEKPEVIIGSSVHLLAVLAAYCTAKYHGSRFVMEVRDLWPQTIIDMGGLSAGSPVTKLLQVLEGFLYRKAERIITLLPRAGEYISACGIAEEKIIWIPNGVDLSRFENIELVGRSSEEFNVMYLGAHGRANALDILILAARLVQDRGFSNIRFVLIGDGTQKPHLVKLTHKLGLSNVEFRDPIQKSKVPQTLQEADAFIFNLEEVKTFKYGISPNKLFDYMAAKKPVIFSVEAFNNPVEEAYCGFTVPPLDPAALAEAVIKLYRMPKEEREAMGAQGREFVEQNHSMPLLADRLFQSLNYQKK